MSKNIIVLGGTGESGRRIINLLSERLSDLKISCAARRTPKAGILPEHINFVPFDINDKAKSIETLRKFDLAVIALGPMDKFALQAHQLCLNANIDALDINDSLQAADQIHALNTEAQSKQRLLLTGMGFSPGISTLLLTELAHKKASATGYYQCRLYMGAAYGGGETSPQAILASFTNHLTCWREGTRKQVETPWQDTQHQFAFPALKKPADLIPFATPEVAGLGCEYVAEDLDIKHLDSRYHIQHLTLGFAKFMSKYRLGERKNTFFSKMFFNNGQKLKTKKESDPDTCLWVYPDNNPQSGLMLHGVISSYELTAKMACVVVECWLNNVFFDSYGVKAVEHLSYKTRQKLLQTLALYGVTAKPANTQNTHRADQEFGWVDSVSSDINSLRNLGLNWYTVTKQHPKMAKRQQEYLYKSEIWRALKEATSRYSFAKFVISTLLAWRRDNKGLQHWRDRHQGEYTEIWKSITKDMSMFSSGYGNARKLLGQDKAYRLYRDMFLETGKMEMRWLWPNPESFNIFENKENVILEYWLTWLRNYAKLGLFTLSESQADSSTICISITDCAYAAMFKELGCPELADMVREMEQEALAFLASQSNLNITWNFKGEGVVDITLSKTLTLQAVG
nr:oxidoreductase [Pseudoalteromonas flavipulchra]